MKSIPSSLKHGKEPFLYSFSRGLERAGYYGVRALIVMYMMGETLEMPMEKAVEVYGVFTGSLIFSHILGALLGDLLIGNRNAILAGGVLQAIGAGLICIPSQIGLYLGLFFIIIGGGLYTPNILAQFGKLYREKVKLIDAGFSIFYIFVSLGAGIGMGFIVFLGEINFIMGFGVASILMFLSTLIIFLLNEPKSEVEEISPTQPGFGFLSLLVTLFLIGIFWTMDDYTSIKMAPLQVSAFASLPFPIQAFSSSLGGISAFFIMVMTSILWSYKYQSHFVKLTLGFVFAAFSVSILLFPSSLMMDLGIGLIVLSLFFMSLSSAHLMPVVLSIISLYSPPKFRATFMSLITVPMHIFVFILGLFALQPESDHAFIFPIGIGVFIVLAIISAGMAILLSTQKQTA